MTIEDERRQKREWAAKYRATHREEYNEYHRRYYAEHTAEAYAATQKWSKANPDKVQKHRATYKAKRKARKHNEGGTD